MKRYSESHHRVLRDILRVYPEVREGRMFGHPAFYVGKKMFACLYEEGVGLKLPADEVAEQLANPGVVPFRPYGKPRMREWLQINRAESEQYQEDIALFERSIRFVSGQG
jgi:TfoX/Sxy family transcriptional regulator of competence genes